MRKRQPEYTLILKKTATGEILMQSKSDCLFVATSEDIDPKGNARAYGGYFYNEETKPRTHITLLAQCLMKLSETKGKLAESGALDENEQQNK